MHSWFSFVPFRSVEVTCLLPSAQFFKIMPLEGFLVSCLALACLPSSPNQWRHLYYSVLFYNSEVWHLRTLNQSMKNQLLSISAKALKLWMKTPDLWMLSFNNLHEMAGRATPEKLGDYKLALRLYKVFKNQIPTQDWVNLNYNIIQTSRQTNCMTAKTNRLKLGMNLISNRFFYLNGKINLDWLNLIG